MTMLREFDVTVPSSAPRGRTVKFTPERMNQIKNLVERGTHREEIAAIIGVTLGSLQVTCSRAGISLRRPRADHSISNGNGVAAIKKESPPPTPIVVGPPRSPESALEAPDLARLPPRNGITVSLRITYKHRTYDMPLTISDETICELACLADPNGMPLTEMIGRALTIGIQEIVK